MKTEEFRQFAEKLGYKLTALQAQAVLRGGNMERRMLMEACDRYLTGELVLRGELSERRERIDQTPIIDVIRVARRFKGGTRIPFVIRELSKDGWMVKDGRTIIWRRNRRYEIGRELEVHEQVYLWDESKVLWKDGLLK